MCFGAWMVLVSVLSNGAASSREVYDGDKWDVVNDECTTTYTNTDSIVFDNVSIVNGLLGFRVDFLSDNGWGGCPLHEVGHTNVLLTSTLGYNPFLGTATFDPGDLVIVDDPGVCD